MLEEKGQVLGEIGEVTGRKMEAGKGSGSLEKREEVLLKILAEEGKGIGWRRLGDWSLSLRDAEVNPKPLFLATLSSGSGGDREEEEGVAGGRKEVGTLRIALVSL